MLAVGARILVTTILNLVTLYYNTTMTYVTHCRDIMASHNNDAIPTNNIDDDDEYIEDEDDYISPEDDYVEDEDDYISPEEDCITIRGRTWPCSYICKIFLVCEVHGCITVICVANVGPGHVGFESFDMHCMFGNEVEMTFNQMMQLRSLVEELPRPQIKEYVCRLIKSNVIPESKMVSLE